MNEMSSHSQVPDKWFDASLQDRNNVAKLKQQVEDGRKLQLPLSSLVEDLKTAKARLVLTLRNSSPDQLIREAEIETRSSRNGQQHSR